MREHFEINSVGNEYEHCHDAWIVFDQAVSVNVLCDIKCLGSLEKFQIEQGNWVTYQVFKRDTGFIFPDWREGGQNLND